MSLNIHSQTKYFTVFDINFTSIRIGEDDQNLMVSHQSLQHSLCFFRHRLLAEHMTSCFDSFAQL
jgi:hypothetical protein